MEDISGEVFQENFKFDEVSSLSFDGFRTWCKNRSLGFPIRRDKNQPAQSQNPLSGMNWFGIQSPKQSYYQKSEQQRR